MKITYTLFIYIVLTLTPYVYGQKSEEVNSTDRQQEPFDARNKSVDNTNKSHSLSVMQNGFELLKSKTHVRELQLENQKKTLERDIYLIFAIVVLLALAIAAIYLYNIRRLNRRLKQTIIVRDKLFSIIGHDLRSPIGGISQLLTMIEDDEIQAEERAEIISMIRRQADVSLEILNSLLLWGQTQLQGVEVHLTFFNPRKVVLKNIEALNDQLQKKSIEIVNEIPDTLVAHGDVNHFDFIIRNLLSNAIKFSFDSGIIWVRSDTTPVNDQIVFSVKDLGKGINAQQLKKFPSESLDVCFGTKGEKGTGFGLMLSKEFVKANQGRMWLESPYENGTTFYFTFPVAK